MRDFQRPGRSLALASRGMAATSHPLATLTAVDILRRGGNAVDAAIAACAVQCVVEPQSTGIGGDCFALFAPASGGVVALNGSGWAPAALDLERLGAGPDGTIPAHSVHSITVPGAVAAWEALQREHGRLDLATVLEPAIRYAQDGFPVFPRVAFDWQQAADRLQVSEAATQFYLPGGRAPETGRILRLPALARTLRRIAEDGAEVFYRGELAERMVQSLQAFGGLHELEDFAAFRPEFVPPLHASYRGLRIYECPPNGQGFVALMMLRILEGFDLAALDPDGAERYHLEAEATKIAFHHRDRWLADPAHSRVPVAEFLDNRYIAQLRASIDPERARTAPPPTAVPPAGDTVYIAVVDGDGNACSFINSLYDSFGSGYCCPRTGVLFHCRGRAFSLDPAHPNALAPRKRPMHTIIPALAFQGGELAACFGVMGADFQPVGQVHLVTNLIDYGWDPQQALDHARAMAYPRDLQLERGIGKEVAERLAAMGHPVVPAELPLGGGQCILIDRKRGVLLGGSDPRKDGIALGF